MAAFIVRAWSARVFNDPEAFQSQTQTTPYFSDVPATNEQFIYIQKLYELGITAGTMAPTIDGNGNLTAQGQFSPGSTLVNYQIAIFPPTRPRRPISATSAAPRSRFQIARRIRANHTSPTSRGWAI
jgi:hypothetical protein